MKQLKCEMCGSTDLIKQDGVFVCQSCGIKYSVEEAKKMMVEGVVEVRGVVEVDTTSKFKNLLQLARRYRQEGNNENAAKNYELALQESPTNWEAVFYSNYCKAKCCRIMDIDTVSTNFDNSLQTVFDLIKKNYPNIEEQKSIVKEVTEKTIELAEMLFNGAWNTAMSSDIATVNRHIGEWFGRYFNATKIFYTVGDIVSIEYINEDDMNKLSITAWKKGLEKHNNFANGFGRELSQPLVSLYNTKINTYSNMINKRADERKKQRYNSYWAEHAEEKAQLESRLSEIEDELKPLKKSASHLDIQYNNISKKKKNPVSIDAEIQVLSHKRSALLKERENLGLFAGKRKKAITEEIQALDTEKVKLDAIAQKQRDELITLLNEELAPIKKELDTLKNQIQKLDKEKQSIKSKLTMSR